MDEHALVLVVALVRVSLLLAKSQLQRLFQNLCQHIATMHSALQIIICVLHAPLSADEASTRRPPGAPPKRRLSSPPASLAGALQMREPFRLMRLLGSSYTVAPHMWVAEAQQVLEVTVS